MNLLFFFTHPSKYHLFRNTINTLVKLGHNVEVLNTSKDILDELVSQEKWQHKNIFPEGRKIIDSLCFSIIYFPFNLISVFLITFLLLPVGVSFISSTISNVSSTSSPI